jgi:hypothetical protein
MHEKKEKIISNSEDVFKPIIWVLIEKIVNLSLIIIFLYLKNIKLKS